MKAKRAELHTQRLVLKCYVPEDMDALLALLCNEEVSRTFMVPEFESREQAEGMFQKLLEISARPDRIEYGVYLDGKLIGLVNESGLEGDTVEIGYVIDPDFWGKGYASEAAGAVIDELFRMGFQHVIAGYFEENPASRRVMEKCGMHPIAKTEDDEYRGKVHHCLFMGIDAPASD